MALVEVVEVVVDLVVVVDVDVSGLVALSKVGLLIGLLLLLCKYQ